MTYKASKHWGGARNFSNRTSEYLTLKQCEMIESAIEQSIKLGVALNRFITINWSMMDIPPQKGASVTARFFKMARDWADKQKQKIYWTYVREAKANGQSHHLHILFHAPEAISHKMLRTMMRAWIKRITGQKYKKGAILTRSIGKRLDSYLYNYESYSENLRVLVYNYLFKGAEKEAVKPLELPLWTRGGLVYGKRCGRSKTLKI